VDAPHRSLDDCKGLADRPRRPNKNDAWWNERQQLARDLLAAGRADDGLCSTVAALLQQGWLSEAEFLAAGFALRQFKRAHEASKRFPDALRGVSRPTISKEPRRILARQQRIEEARPRQGGWGEGMAAAAGYARPSRPARRAQTARSAPRLPSDPVALTIGHSRTTQQPKFVTMGAISARPETRERARPFCAALAPH